MLIKKITGKRLVLWIIYGFGIQFHIQAQSPKNDSDTTLRHSQYISAFSQGTGFSEAPRMLSTDTIRGSVKYYTIQICTLNCRIEDAFFQGNGRIRCIKMGELYRYIFPQCYTIEEIRKKLASVQKIFPQACIREYHQGILGQIIDMDIEHIK